MRPFEPSGIHRGVVDSPRRGETAIFSVVNWVVLRPLAFADPDDVVRVWWRPDSFNQRILVFFQERARSFSGLSGYSGWGFTLVGDGEPEELSGAVVSTNHFSVLGVRPLLGRGFAPEEGEPGRAEVCVLSEGLWRRRFGADGGILGRRIRLAGAGRSSCTVVGVVSDAEATLDAFGPRQAFLPLERAADLEKDESWFLSVVARLKPGVSLEAANAEIKELSRFVRESMYPRTSAEDVLSARVERLQDAIVGTEIRGQLLLLSVAVALVLLSACFNLSALLLARYGEREREMAVRSALGARRGRVLRQLLTESAVLGLAGGAVGSGVAAAASHSLASLLPPELPRTEGLAADFRVLLFALGLSVVAAVAFGLLPSLRASAKTGTLALRRSATSGGPNRQRLHRALVAFEIACCLVLLTAAGLVLDSFLRLSRTDPGFDAESALVAAGLRSRRRLSRSGAAATALSGAPREPGVDRRSRRSRIDPHPSTGLEQLGLSVLPPGKCAGTGRHAATRELSRGVPGLLSRDGDPSARRP
jgi:predicted permease